MLKSETRRIFIRLAILAALVSCLALLSAGYPAGTRTRTISSNSHGVSAIPEPVPPTTLAGTSQQTSIKIAVDQLPTEKGLSPVEILRPEVSSSAPNQIEDVTYSIRNNTHNPITGVAVIRDITYEEEGAVYTHSAYSTLDYSLHSDMTRGAFGPGTEQSMDSAGPLSFNPGVAVKEIRLRIDYVQFANNAAIGRGGEGERRILLMREGAAKYKTWLVKQYKQKGRSLSDLLASIEKEGVPGDLALTDVSQNMGAERYRRYFLRSFRTHGPTEVENLLSR